MTQECHRERLPSYHLALAVLWISWCWLQDCASYFFVVGLVRSCTPYPAATTNDYLVLTLKLSVVPSEQECQSQNVLNIYHALDESVILSPHHSFEDSR
jgi:hypothetical protein